jgi:hypothetical protein
MQLRTRRTRRAIRATVAVDVFHAVAGAMRGADDVVGLAWSPCFRAATAVEACPGTGKTLLAKSLAAAIGGQFGRVQCTPDLLPADVTGTPVYSPATGVGVPARARSSRTSCSSTSQPGVAAHPGRAPRTDGGAPGHDRQA